METIVKAEKLIKYYGTKENPVKAVDQIDLEIKRGAFRLRQIHPAPSARRTGQARFRKRLYWGTEYF